MFLEQFITEMHRLGDSCEFGEMNEDLMRDHLVVRICDHYLSKWLQMEPDLILDKANRLIRQRDTVKEQQETLKVSIKEENAFDTVSRKTPKKDLMTNSINTCITFSTLEMQKVWQWQLS